MLLLLSGERDARLERERSCLFFPICCSSGHGGAGVLGAGPILVMLVQERVCWGMSFFRGGHFLRVDVSSSRGGTCGWRCPRCLGCVGVGPPGSHLPCNTGCWCEDAVRGAACFATSVFSCQIFPFLANSPGSFPVLHPLPCARGAEGAAPLPSLLIPCPLQINPTSWDCPFWQIFAHPGSWSHLASLGLATR